MSGRGTPGRLHVITDVTLQARFSHVELARIAAAAGADVVQYRDKRPIGFDERRRTAGEMRAALDGTALVVNDHVDVARACAAEGVHLGGGDARPADARRRLGPRCWIGVTANSLEQARSADVTGVDYIGVGPVFGTASKSAPAPALGLEGLRRILAAVGRPVIAIGGIGPDNVDAVLAAGAHGVAVLSSVVCDIDPARQVRRLRDRIERRPDVALTAGGAGARR